MDMYIQIFSALYYTILIIAGVLILIPTVCIGILFLDTVMTKIRGIKS